MDAEEFKKMTNALKESIRAYPNCKVASCECNEHKNEWKKGCICPGHWLQMDLWYGKGKWKISDCANISRIGIKINTPAKEILKKFPLGDSK